MTSRILALGIALAAPGLSQQTASESPSALKVDETTAVGGADADPVIAATRAELDRAVASLRLEGRPAPYYAGAVVNDYSVLQAGATRGSLLASSNATDRHLQLYLRVGTEARDNSKLLNPRGGAAIPELPEDDDIGALRRALWLGLDETYKIEVEDYARKLAALARQSQSETPDLPDFQRPRGAVVLQPLAAPNSEIEPWEKLVREASRDLPNSLEDSEVATTVTRRLARFVDSDGNVARHTKSLYEIVARAQTRAGDGMVVRDYVSFHAARPEDLPTPEALRAAVRELGARVVAAAAAPAMPEPYTGPVLFEGDAAAAVLVSLVGHAEAPAPEPVLEDPRMAAGVRRFLEPSPWIGRVGKRVTARFFDIKDDPTLATYRGQALVGHYPIDDEGVVPVPVTIVERGILRGFITTRTPREVGAPSTGHARALPGLADFFGCVRPVPGVLVFGNADGDEVTPEEVRARFLETLGEEGLSHGYVVRRVRNLAVDPPEADEAATLGERGPAAVGDPLEVVRVAADGSESAARGVRFSRLDARALRNVILASAGETGTRLTNLVAAAPGVRTSGAITTSVIGPMAVLFEELELVPEVGPFERPPVYPSPPERAAPVTKPRRGKSGR